MQRIIPHLWFDGAAEAAARLYAEAFPDTRAGRVLRYGKAGFEIHRQPEGAVMTVEVVIGDTLVVGLNGGPIFRPSPAVSYFVMLESETEVEHAWATLSDGGTALMPLDSYPWSARYGWLDDRFGVSWQIALGKRADVGRAVTPCLFFTGEQAGRAADAVAFYTALFPGSSVDGILRHDGSGPEPAGYVQHAQFRLGGETFMAMDGGPRHAVAFSEANSHLVLCRDQDEVDRYWDALSAHPEAEACGWVKDRFGVSWQIVPGAAERDDRRPRPGARRARHRRHDGDAQARPGGTRAGLCRVTARPGAGDDPEM